MDRAASPTLRRDCDDASWRDRRESGAVAPAVGRRWAAWLRDWFTRLQWGPAFVADRYTRD